MNRPAESSPVVRALLGPTNTGKTHRAVEAMLEHESGMIGLPLRLLAREVYDRLVNRLGEGDVSLVTGEEKRIAPGGRYWVCTVEAMPADREVDFLAVDEIQLAAHRERGHVFTDRLLHARGRRQTWFLGAETVRALLEHLVPEATIERHPRLSRLTRATPTTLGGLPPRSAVVAFSMERVYEIAERLRRRRGGAAVVLGALSPRARNAQVALYQAGEVDYLVATDAIGMGLNLDVTHVAFADTRKFDGQQQRALEPSELAQIAGRAGRHLRDGTFGTLASAAALPERVLRDIERHRFSPEQRLVWRNSELEFSSVDALLQSLCRPSPDACLRVVEQAEDHSTLLAVARNEDVRALARDPERVRLLWEVVQIPDYRQLMLNLHAGLVTEIYLELCKAPGRLSDAFVDRRLQRLDDPAGDIDTLLARMAAVRTWTYVTNHATWVQSAAQWRARARSIEDRLSDALHLRLVERFAPADGRIRRHASAPNSEAHPFAKLEELKRELFGSSHDLKSNPRLEEVVELDPTGALRDASGRRIGELAPGPRLLRPALRLAADASTDSGTRARITRSASAQVLVWVGELLGPSFDDLERASPTVRGLLYGLAENLGCIERSEVAVALRALAPEDRRDLRRRGVRVGNRWLFVPGRVGRRWTDARAALLRAHYPREPLYGPGTDRLVVRVEGRASRVLQRRLGHPLLGSHALRVDAAEHLLRASGQPDVVAELARWLALEHSEVATLLRAARKKNRKRRARARARRAS
ncbi:MAG: helicase [Polyangiaceae bacterium]|nr:helicase [Polyangiaceae bacterium]